MNEVEIVPLSRSARDVSRFLNLSYRIYDQDPLWVAPLLMDLKKVFSDANPLFDHADAAETGAEVSVALPVMPLSEHVVNDYRTLRLSLKAHPMSFLRERVQQARIAACADLKQVRDGAWVSVAGVVLVRQRPGSAQGVVFMTIEDETGIANSVIWPKVLERMRKVVMGARLVVVHGRVQRHEDIIHVVAERLEDRSDWLRLLTEDGVMRIAIGDRLADSSHHLRPASVRKVGDTFDEGCHGKKRTVIGEREW